MAVEQQAGHEKGAEFIPTSTQYKFDVLLQKYRHNKEFLIVVLQQTQDIYGYLPKSSLLRIAEALNVPLAKIYGVVTFYSQFSLTLRGRHLIRICQGTACHVRGTSSILKKIKEELGINVNETTNDLRYTLGAVMCLGACGLAPVITIDGDTHGRLTPSKVPSILAKYE